MREILTKLEKFTGSRVISFSMIFCIAILSKNQLEKKNVQIASKKPGKDFFISFECYPAGH